MKHTPGPWTACNNNGYSIWRVTHRASSASRTIAEVVGDSAETETNARLIAAAPEMYELIQTVARTWENDCQFIPCDTEAASALSGRLARLAGQAAQLLDKIEGGEA